MNTPAARAAPVTLIAWATLSLVACSGDTSTEGPAASASGAAETEPFSAAGLKTAEVQSFLATLQGDVRSDDRAAVAQLVSYPIDVHIDGEALTLHDPGEFVGSYPRFMNERVRKALDKATPQGLFANYQGIRVGDGEIWFGGVQEEGKDTYEVRILTINTE